MNFSFSTIVDQFAHMGVKRAIIGEHAYYQRLVVAVARKNLPVVKQWMGENAPIGVVVEYRCLPWWKCWFSHYQLNSNLL